MVNRLAAVTAATATAAALLLGVAAAPAHPRIGYGAGSGARVATLPGAFGAASWSTGFLRGTVCAAPNVCTPIQYYNVGDFLGGQTGLASLNDGERKIDQWMRRTPGKKVVMGHSQGALVIYKWLRDHSFDRTGPPPSELRFIALASSERRVTGYALFDPTGMYAARKPFGMGLPANTPYRVLDVCIKWDGWCYWVPGDPRSKRGQNTLHLEYGKVDVNDPANKVDVRGAVTYVLVPAPKGWDHR